MKRKLRIWNNNEMLEQALSCNSALRGVHGLENNTNQEINLPTSIKIMKKPPIEIQKRQKKSS